ncbi:MAG TPA: hypothetical protein ENK78_07515 [Thiothrix sp.]|nr:hypothetical protein [Thiothrix sp.]
MIKSSMLLAVGILIAGANAALANCSRSDVDHYLKSGFSHTQIVQLCGAVNKGAAPAPVVAAPHSPIPQTAPVVGANHSQNESVFFKSAINARQVDLFADKIVYTDKACIKFGLEDMMGEKEELCRDVQTSIHFAGLQVIRATRGIPLIQKRELVVQGTINRVLLKPDSIPAKFKQDFFDDFATQPKTINIPIRERFDPEEVAQRLLAKK